MGKSGVVRSHNTPSASIPAAGKVGEDNGEASLNKSRTVFHEDESRSNLVDDSCHLPPQGRGGAGDPLGVLLDRGNVRTGKAARNDVNTAAPLFAGKGANVIPNEERREKAFILSGEQYAGGVGVALDGANCSPSEEVSSEYASTNARE